MPRRGGQLAILLGLAALAPCGLAQARDDLSGGWREEYDEVVVSLDQWSAACGEAPRTTGWRVRGLEFEVEDRGVELLFRGQGGSRFSSVDCQTANPEVKPKERNLQDLLFMIACSTPEDAASYENGLYSFRVVSRDRLEYRETTRYARNAQGAQCASTRRVHRAYVRLSASPRPEVPDAGVVAAAPDAGAAGKDPGRSEGNLLEGQDGGSAAVAGQAADPESPAGPPVLGTKLPKPPLPHPPVRTPVDRGGPEPADAAPALPEAVDAGPPKATDEPAEPEALQPEPVQPEPSAPPPPHPPRNSSPEVSSEDGWILWVGLGGGLVLVLLVVAVLLSRKPRWQPPAAPISQAKAPSEPPASAPPASEPPVFCTGCGARLPDGAKFCPHCRTKVR